MSEEEIKSEIRKPKVSTLAILSLVFGVGFFVMLLVFILIGNFDLPLVYEVPICMMLILPWAGLVSGIATLVRTKLHKENLCGQ